MGLSRLSEKCRLCPKADACNNKRMEALGFLDGPCERELATGTAIAGPVNIGPADAVTALQDAVEKSGCNSGADTAAYPMQALPSIAASLAHARACNIYPTI